MLEVRDLRKRFGGLSAVDGASLDVAEGEIVALIGPNGAGKTTLFASISGFVRPDAGAVRFLGADIAGVAPHLICARGLARTFQIVQPFEKLSVRENIAVGAHLHRPARREALAHAEAVACRVGLERRLDQPAASLTVAARKRLELAKALATDPKLLLLDEVMAGLNPTEVDEVVAVIRAIRADGVTVLLTEHVMQAVVSLAERVYVLANGRIIAQGTTTSVTSDAAVIEAYLGRGAAERLRSRREVRHAP
ncbi:ABC transporter ATP-binding protein [Bradyrhizobium sp. LHD-71]|uniref:ABC transporter ATP-binding protein n=1 Tax=Bradyrhizobium sp. LHD-71 TaxID=3072141 RepID=UPI00280EFF44|nr:ABC transporter ATP-binding protein [Bradyrhizobium sp. LHD-71]MDQ8732015.1 ABC transporter ATP-binding protein [Bradyrhizobium sp. LHD-71]